MIIRFERVEDIEQIRDLNRVAFNSETEAALVDALRQHGVERISLVADENGDVIGHILFTPVTIDTATDINIAGLAPMAVLPDWQNRGVGSRLVSEGLQACEKAAYDAVVVLGHADYYPRFGFVPSVKYKIKSEYNVPPEVFMLKEIKKDALKGVSGVISYHPLFNEI